MKKFSSIQVAIFAIAFSFCGESQSKAYQKLKMDEYYSYLKSESSRDTKTHDYIIKPADGFIFDSKGYNFSTLKSLNNNKLPDVLHLLSDKKTYRIDFKPQSETIVDKTTMVAIGNDTPKNFAGFKRGEKYFIGIGKGEFQDTAYVIKPFWFTVLLVE